MSIGGRSGIWQPNTNIDRVYERGAVIPARPGRTIFDRQVYMIGADDGAGGSPARMWSEYDGVWSEITAPPIPFAGCHHIGVFGGDPSRFYVGGGYRTDTLAPNARYWEYFSAQEFGFRDTDRYEQILPDHPVPGEKFVVYNGRQEFAGPWFYFLMTVGAAAPSDISWYSWSYGGAGNPGTSFYDGAWRDDGSPFTIPPGSGNSQDVANIRGMLQFGPGVSEPVYITKTGQVGYWAVGLGFLPTLSGTNTDDVRLVFNGDPVDTVGMYAIRVQSGVATTAIYNESGSGTWNIASKAPLPRPRGNFGCAGYSTLQDYPADNTKIYIVGGDGTPWFDIYDARTNTWSEGPDLDVGVSNVSIAAYSAVRTVPVG